MELFEKAKYVSDKTGLPYHLFLAYLTDKIRLVCARGNDLPSDSEIKSFESEICWSLPNDYREFVLNFGAIYMEISEQYWPKSKVGSVMPFWATNYGFIIYGIGENTPEHMNIRKKYLQFKEVFPDLLFFVPIQRLVPGDQSYVGYNKAGDIVVKHSGDDDLRAHVYESFNDLILAEAKDLDERLGKKAKLDLETLNIDGVKPNGSKKSMFSKIRSGFTKK